MTTVPSLGAYVLKCGWLSCRSFHCIPLQPSSLRHKPCLFIWTQFEDHNFRLYQTNFLSKMADRLVSHVTHGLARS